MRGSALVLLPVLALAACSPTEAADAGAESVERAKEAVASHERYATAGDLDGVVGNAAEDIVVLAAGAPLVEGREAFRHFYAELLAAGEWEFTHDYGGAATVGNAVVLHGVARGTMTPAEGEASSFTNNFVLVLRPGPDGTLKVWRAAFAPAGR